MPSMIRKKSPKFHYEIADHLTDPSIKKLVIQAPRGFAKTTLVAIVYTLWHIFISDFARGQNRRPKFVVLGSKSLQPHTINLLETIKMILEDSKPLRALFGDWGEATAKRWTTSEIVLKDGTTILCRGSSQPIRGLNKRGIRPTLFVWDDPEDEKNTRTVEAMGHNMDILLKGVLPALCNEYGDKVVVIGTPIHERGMVNELTRMAELESAPVLDEDGNVLAESGWRSLHYSGIIHEDGESLETGKSLWPEKVPLEIMLAQKAEYETAGKLSVFYSETMCEIVSDADRVFGTYGYYKGRVEIHNGYHYLIITHQGTQEEHKRQRKASMVELKEPKVVPVTVFMGVDPASSTNSRADRSVIMPIALDAQDNRYVLPYFAGRFKPLRVSEEIIKMDALYKPNRIRVESVGYQEMLKDTVKGKTGTRVQPGKPRGDRKTDRLEGMQVHFGAGRMWLMEMGSSILEDEMLLFPSSRHDDTLDAMYYAMERTYPPMHGLEYYKMEKKAPAKKKKAVSWMAA